jgi:hypothetical protein
MRQRRGEARGADRPALAAWKLPLIVTALAVAIVGGFYVGGPGLGLAVGALAATSIVVMAVRHPPLHPIVPAPLGDFRRHVLVVVSAPLEDSATIDQIARAARIGDGEEAEAEILVLSPARIGFLDRWSSDFRRASQRAQSRLVVSLASLAKAEVAATARVGDENLIQAVDDTLRSFPATEVILVTGSPESDPAGNAAVPELESRLRADFRHLALSPDGRLRPDSRRAPGP